MDDDSQAMLEAELEILQAAYPEQAKWTPASGELHFLSDDNTSSFTLRLPPNYPGTARPEVLVATIHKGDVRDKLQALIKDCELESPVLDVVIEAFNDWASQKVETADEAPDRNVASTGASLTVVVWLHHLLNTNKRKQALSPVLEGVAGVSKPGYPGVLVFSGPAPAVTQHVEELKALRWQGFQIRLELDELWHFQHDTGVAEVESMADVVGSVDATKKDILLQAIMRQ